MEKQLKTILRSLHKNWKRYKCTVQVAFFLYISISLRPILGKRLKRIFAGKEEFYLVACKTGIAKRSQESYNT